MLLWVRCLIVLLIFLSMAVLNVINVENKNMCAIAIYQCVIGWKTDDREIANAVAMTTLIEISNPSF